MISSAFWRDRRVFVTGHTGFKGAWLSLMLERLNARVTGYGLPPATFPSLYALTDAGAHLCDVRGDVRDAALLDGALRAADPDIVIHMATRPPRGDTRPHPGSARAARATGERAIIDAVEAAPSVHTALIVVPEMRKAPRARNKRVDETAARILTVYCPDPIGGGDFAAEQGADAGSLHALDALYGLLLLAEKSCEGDAPGGSRWAFADPVDAAALGWSPLLTADEATDWTRDWLAAHARSADMRAVTIEQVDRYLGQRVRLTSPFGIDRRFGETASAA